MLAHHFITRALAASDAVANVVGERIYNWPDDEVSGGTANVPFIVVKADGFTNEPVSKDNGFESGVDTDTVRVTIVAKTDDDICRIASAVRQAVVTYTENITDEEEEELGFFIDDYKVTGSGINYDEVTDARAMVLTYVVENETIKY